MYNDTIRALISSSTNRTLSLQHVLIQHNVQDYSRLELLCKNTDIDKTELLNYIIETLPQYLILTKLTLINTYYANITTNQDEKKRIFEYCLKTRHQQLTSIEIYHLLYSILDNINYIGKEGDYSKEQSQRNTIHGYEEIIETYVYNPSQCYPPRVVQIDKDVSLKVGSCFELFNILYESNLAPIQYNPLFTFSEPWQRLLGSLDYDSFIFETNIIQDSLQKEKFNNAFHDFQINDKEGLIDKDTFDTTLKECLTSLAIAHPRSMIQVTWCLIHLMYFADKHLLSSEIKEYYNSCRATWLYIFQSLLDDAIFDQNLTASRSIYKLCIAVACYIQYRNYSSADTIMEDIHQLILRIWDHFYIQRTAFMKDKHDSLAMVEKILFTFII